MLKTVAKWLGALGAFGAFVMTWPALAQTPAVGGAPQSWQLNFQPPASPSAEGIESLHDLLLIISVAISLFVLVLLVVACLKFRASRNPTPSRRTHNTVLEIAWTALPVLILVVIAIPSFKLLYFMDRAVDAEMTIKAIGRQWYWSYEYPDHGNFTFDSYMVPDEDLDEGMFRLFEVDNRVRVPAGVNIRLLTTASDVLHSWAVSALGVKLDAVPGRINETWFRVNEPGVYFGQCSELCGTYHAFMPIAIEALPPEEFEAWVAQAQEQFARVGEPGVDVATAPAE